MGILLKRLLCGLKSSNTYEHLEQLKTASQMCSPKKMYVKSSRKSTGDLRVDELS